MTTSTNRHHLIFGSPDQLSPVVVVEARVEAIRSQEPLVNMTERSAVQVHIELKVAFGLGDDFTARTAHGGPFSKEI
jgi:hypothetical protein